MSDYVDIRDQQIMRLCAERDAAEARIAAALACHTQGLALTSCKCGMLWDTDRDRCTSPTVAALTAEGKTP
jgi:hypothetical protein